jgi:hypothetical protein
MTFRRGPAPLRPPMSFVLSSENFPTLCTSSTAGGPTHHQNQPILVYSALWPSGCAAAALRTANGDPEAATSD